MKIRVTEVKFTLDEPVLKETFLKKVAKKTALKETEIQHLEIIRESIDARKEIVFSYIVDIETDRGDWLLKKGFSKAPEPYFPVSIKYQSQINATSLKNDDRPVIIGYGPGGIFAAYELATAGLNPIVIEMGEPVEDRQKTVEHFWNTGTLNPQSNVQFGEGGAGTFSDGKLTTRIKDERIERVLEVLVDSGAPEDIRYRNKPHIGTDVLSQVVKNIRVKTQELGAEIHFNTQAIAFESLGDNHTKVICHDGKTFCTKSLILAIGHSSRSTLMQLKMMNMALEKKPFAMGVRIEHPQPLINLSQFGPNFQHPRLGAAEYKVTHSTKNNRSVYSFCMCPGGKVVASASEENRLVVNGMSYHSRSLSNANSALLVNIQPTDFETEDVLAGIELQRKLEERAYALGGGNYSAPIQSVGDFRQSVEAKMGYTAAHPNSRDIKSKIANYEEMFEAYQPTYEPSVKHADLTELFPNFMTEALYEALGAFGKKIPGFDDERIILTAIESRSSSPVRIIRDAETLESITHPGIYPCGEGAGYAGGITSSAVDGIKIAEKIILKCIAL